MKAQIQANYEERLKCYAALIHDNEPPGLVAKLAIYSSLLKQREQRGGGLWQIEPLLFPLMHSVEVDLHLATAKLLENPERGERSLFKFLDFCLTNRTNISWKSGPPPESVIRQQLDMLEKHRPTITMIMGRRDKFFAHLDKRYFANPSAIYADFPLNEADVIALVNCVIDIVLMHQINLNDSFDFHVGEFYKLAVDNMVRNLDVGRRVNFPVQPDSTVQNRTSQGPFRVKAGHRMRHSPCRSAPRGEGGRR